MEPEPSETPITRMADDLEPHPNAELLELVTELRADNEAVLRREQVISLLLVKLERLTQAKLACIEEAKSALAGITPSGRELD